MSHCHALDQLAQIRDMPAISQDFPLRIVHLIGIQSSVDTKNTVSCHHCGVFVSHGIRSRQPDIFVSNHPGLDRVALLDPGEGADLG